ncbi:MAG: hypothetical protein R3D25_13430 [Geminicoccaceae bacterium]
MLALFYGGLQIALGPGRLDVVHLPPPFVTGLYLVDSALAGQWDVFRNAAAHHPAVDRAGGDHARLDHVDHQPPALGSSARLCQGRPRQGPHERTIIIRHALPNALIPVVTLGGLAYAVP